MGDQLVIPEEGAAALSRSRLEAMDVARERVRRPNSDNTNRVYATARAQWCAYCDALGRPWGPIDPEELIYYLEELGKRLAPNTVRLHLAALADVDKACRLTPAEPRPPSIRTHPIVERWYRSWSRDNPHAPRKRAAALEASGLERLLSAAAEPQKHANREGHVLRYARDRCLILFGASGAFRASELGAIELAHVESTERGLRVYLPSSKGDQQGQGEWVGLMPQGKVALCPIDAHTQWRRLRGESPGALFVGIDRSALVQVDGDGLSERQITRLVSHYAKRAGLLINVSAHSLRATLATLAAEKGRGLAQIMKHMRSKSAHVAAGYVRQGELFRDNVTGGLFD